MCACVCVQLDDCVLCRIHNKASKQNHEEEDGEKMNAPSPSQVIMSGGRDRDMKIDNNYYDQDGDEGYLQNFLGVLEQGEPPSMEDILQPQPQAFGVQGLIFDASASTGVQGFDASASTSTSAASQNNNSNIYTNTNFSTSASSSQNNNSHIYTTNFSDKGPTF